MSPPPFWPLLPFAADTMFSELPTPPSMEELTWLHASSLLENPPVSLIQTSYLIKGLHFVFFRVDTTPQRWSDFFPGPAN